MNIEITRCDANQRKPAPPSDTQLGFGRYFTDHMFKVDYAPDEGWRAPRIEPYGPLALDPACMVLHYAQEIFEGMKAYHGVDGAIRLFRPEMNIERMRRSAKRLCMPDFDTDETLDALKQLVLLEREWIPKTEGCALYIRPTMIATDPFLGVRPSTSYLFYIILSPVGAYYPEGFNPVSIMVQTNYVRAVEGGIGDAKTGGNYAASLAGQLEAKSKGFTQVLWLDAKERRYIEEVGTMNMFFVIGDQVLTSPLTGTILPGVTRDSVLEILKRWGTHEVVERQVTIDEVVEASENGTLKEAFGTGTAAIISPVGRFRYHDKDYKVADGMTGSLSQKLYDYILALQFGHKEDPFGWVQRIDL
ncbi:MAG: branched-chain amino acid aminotransferase [Deltaproteobacteria bacterium]|nr:branched-chain amino acid aminotransferase [Deltaproteobacteria bacterium]